MRNNIVWLHNSVFDWYTEIQSYSYTSVEDRVRAYELWEHAQSLLTDEATEFNRVDVISNLKRSLNQRLKFIEYVYSFKKLSLNDSPKGYLEYLETLGIVRPYMLKQLMLIRNDIEHNDSPPPNVDRCRELVDLMWYFLKSTDSIVSWCKNDFTFKDLTENGDETQYWISVDIDFELDHTISISGWLPDSLVSEQEKDDFTSLNVDDIGTKSERWGGTNSHTDKLDTDVWLRGKLAPQSEVRLNIVKSGINSSM